MITVLAPDGATRSLRPTVLWQAEGAPICDVVLKNASGQPLMEATGVTSAATFDKFKTATGGVAAPLSADEIYSIVVTTRPSGASATAFFATTADARVQEHTEELPDPRTIVCACLDSLVNQDPPSFGDVLVMLATLPDEAQKEEVVLRLRLYCLGQREHAEAFHELYQAEVREKP